MSAILALILSLLFMLPAEYDCLTEAVYYEAGNQSNTGKLSVALVIKNRVEHNRWPDSYCEVVQQRGQFSYYWDGNPEPMPKNDSVLEWKAYYESRAIAFLALLPVQDITNGSVYYHSYKVEPKWAKKVAYEMTVEDHIFYSE